MGAKFSSARTHARTSVGSMIVETTKHGAAVIERERGRERGRGGEREKVMMLM